MKGVELLGYTLCDRITGFKGVCIGHVTYISGCNQVSLQPRIAPGETKRPEPEWFDEQRVDLCPAHDCVVLENAATPGCDAPPPNR